MRLRAFFAAAGAGAAVVAMPIAVGPAAVAGPKLVPMSIEAPDAQARTADGTAACTSPAPVHTYAFFHCYTPADILAAYGVDAVHTSGDLGQGQTIVLVDAYGSPTAAGDLQFFHDT